MSKSVSCLETKCFIGGNKVFQALKHFVSKLGNILKLPSNEEKAMIVL